MNDRAKEEARIFAEAAEALGVNKYKLVLIFDLICAQLMDVKEGGTKNADQYFVEAASTLFRGAENDSQ